MAHRYAIFYAPPPGSALERFGMAWLGRDHCTGAALPQPEIAGFAPERLAAVTAAPRRYGFHGTLKAPFRLKEGQSEQRLHAAVAGFAETRRSFALPPLRLADLDGFLALVPSAPAASLEALAADCVVAFEPFRAPLSEAEIARRRPERLNERQRRQLDQHGYPWIFTDFTFHLTLTERLDALDKAVVWPALVALTEPLTSTPCLVDAVAVYAEPEPGAAFVMTGRYALRLR